jgi:cytoskeletal protein RodZ
MTIEGLGKKFQEARIARKLTLDEASRMTKIRPSRLAEIEADDFSQFPSLAYAKGFLLIYGKFLDVDVTPYMEAFEGSDAVTVDGYSYLQDNPAPKPVRAAVAPRRPRPRPVASSSGGGSGGPTSLMPLVIGIVVVVVGYMAMRLILNIQRIAPHKAEPAPVVQASVGAPSYTPAATATIAPTAAPTAAAIAAQPARIAESTPSAAPSLAPTAAPTAAAVAVATPSATATAAEPEVRRAQPVRPEDLTKSAATEGAGPNRVAIKALKKTYIKVIVDSEANTPAFERWISATDGTVEFRGQHFSIRVLDRDALQIKKNGKSLAPDDADVTIE